MSVPLAITLVAAIAILVVYVLLAVRLWQRTWHSLSESDRGPSSYRANMANLVLYTLLIGVTSLAAIFIGGRPIVRHLASASWPTTSGQITAAEVREHRFAGRGLTVTRWDPVVVYEYQVGETSLTNDEVRFSDEAFTSSLEGAERAVAPYEPGQTVTVTYNPANPEIAVLERRVETESYLIAGGGLLLLVLHLLGMANRARLRLPVGQPFTGPYQH